MPSPAEAGTAVVQRDGRCIVLPTMFYRVWRRYCVAGQRGPLRQWQVPNGKKRTPAAHRQNRCV